MSRRPDYRGFVTRAAIDRTALLAALGPRWAGVEIVDETASTNAALLADPEAPDRSVLVAEHQTSGRGRLDRSWQSPARAGLTFSVLLRPEPPIATWGWLPLLVGVALHDAVRQTTGVDVGLKWPNDLLHRPSERKLAGVLAQTSDEAVVVGIGLNVSTTPDELPVPTAGSLVLCGADDPDRTALLAAILGEVDRRLVEWTEARGGAETCPLAADYRTACATLGRSVNVSTTSGTVVSGRAVDIDSAGRLQVDTGVGVEAVGAGDVEHVR
jgi:BirA family transcriptional regulator, biotin operon repressor / biotin---[acetyl-CoA-carboxylase] ligase